MATAQPTVSSDRSGSGLAIQERVVNSVLCWDDGLFPIVALRTMNQTSRTRDSSLRESTHSEERGQ